MCIRDRSESMVAATILKIQEKKTQKGTSYAIIKFSDLASVFELFVFSDTFTTYFYNFILYCNKCL